MIEHIKIKSLLNFVRVKYEDDEGVYIIFARYLFNLSNLVFTLI